VLNCDGVSAKNLDKLEQLVTLVRQNHITVLLETRVSDLTPLAVHLDTHSKCFHNTVDFEGRRGQGVAIFVHNSLTDLVRIWKVSDDIQAVWIKICGSVFGVGGQVILGGVYINPQSLTRNESHIRQMFSNLQMEVSEAQANCSHLFLMGDFNARLDRQPDPFDEPFSFLLESFPCLKETRAGQHHNSRMNTAGECLLDIAVSTPLILTTGRGRGDNGQPTFFGYNAASAPNATRTEHIVVSPDLYSCCQEIQVLHHIDLMDHRPLTCQFLIHGLPHLDVRLPGHATRQRHDQPRLKWKQDSLNRYVTYLQENESAQQVFYETIQEGNADSACDIFVSYIQHAAETADMVSNGKPHRARIGLPMAPWFDGTCKAYKADIRRLIRQRLPVTDLKRAYSRHCRMRKRAHQKFKAQEIVDLIDSRNVDAYKVMRLRKHQLRSPIPADIWTQHLQQHFVQTHQDSNYRGRTHARLPPKHQALSDQLRSRSVTPSEIATPPGPGGRYRQRSDNAEPPVQPSPNTYTIPDTATLASHIQRNISRMNSDSSSGFDNFSTPFIKYAEREYTTDRGKRQTENVLLPLLTVFFRLLLSAGALPKAWTKTKITPVHKRNALTDPKSYRMLAINGCLYRLYANVVRDILTAWALTEGKIPDTQFGFCPTRNTNQPLYILRHVLSAAKANKKKLYTVFLDLEAAYDNVQRDKLWKHLESLKMPAYLLRAIMAMYRGGVYILVDGDKISGAVAPNKGLKQGCPLSPLLYTLFTNDMDRFLDSRQGAITAIEATRVPHCDYADDTMILANSTEHIQFQLNRFRDYAQFKRLTVNTEKTKVMVFFSSDTTPMPTFMYDGRGLEVVSEFKYLGLILRRDGKMTAATDQMARNFMGGIARVQKAGAELGVLNRKHAMLWLFQTFALTVGLYGCQIWATDKLSYDTSTKTKAHVYHAGFLKSLLGVKRATETHCLLRETGQMPLYFYWFRCVMRFWNSLLSTNNDLLSRVVQADMRYADRAGSWTYHVITALNHVSNAQQFAAAVRSGARVNMNDLEGLLREQVIQDWRSLDNLTPQEAHSSSRIMRTYHTHFGIPLGTIPGWWDARKRNKKPLLPNYLRKNIPHNLLRSISCLRLSSHNFRVETQRHQGNRCPYELRICNKCDWHTVQDEEHIILDCPSEDLTGLRTQFQHLFSALPEDGATRLRHFMNQTDVLELAKFVSACLKCCA
jgi:exonuclease III